MEDREIETLPYFAIRLLCFSACCRQGVKVPLRAAVMEDLTGRRRALRLVARRQSDTSVMRLEFSIPARRCVREVADTIRRLEFGLGGGGF